MAATVRPILTRRDASVLAHEAIAMTQVVERIGNLAKNDAERPFTADVVAGHARTIRAWAQRILDTLHPRDPEATHDPERRRC